MHVAYLRRPGFTLVEMMVVITVLAILVSVVAPLGASRRDRVLGAVRVFVADVESARVRSLANGSDPCRLTFDVGGTRDGYAVETEAGNVVSAAVFGEGGYAELDGVTIESLDDVSDERIVFTALGSLDQPDDPVVVLRAGDDVFSVQIDAMTGETRVFQE